MGCGTIASGVCPYDPKLVLTRFPVEIRGDDIMIETDTASV